MCGTELHKFESLSCLDGYNFLDRLWQKYVKPLQHRQQYSQYLLLALLLIGIFHPTSWHGEISVFFRRSSIYLLNLLLFILLLLNGLGDRIAYRCGLAIPLILFAATCFSSLENVTLGAYVYFLPISLLFWMNLREVSWSLFLSNCFIVVNFLIVVTAVAIILDVQLFENGFLELYNAYRDNLLKRMLDFGKPVSFFTSHSIAAFMYSLLSYLNFRIFLHSRRVVYFLFALFYIVVLLFLESNSAYYSFLLLLLVSVYYLRASIFQHKKIFSFILLSFLVIFVFSFYYEVGFFYDCLTELYTSVEARFSNKGSGFIGRYSSHGVLAGNILFIQENPFSPVGLRNSEQFWFMDSGIVEYMLRGSLFLVFAIYYGMFRFLRYHLPLRATCWIIFIFIFINELGFPYLKYVRFMCLFPFAVVYFRYIELDCLRQKRQSL